MPVYCYNAQYLETKAQMLAACGTFSSGKAPTRRWRDDPPLMQFLRSLLGPLDYV